MELETWTTSTSIEKLKCALCKNYLSHFPIRMCSNNQNICGRCIAPQEEFVIQNIAYETLSQFLKFPCCYKNEGCQEELQPKNVPKHEKDCQFRIILCPTRKFSNCEWKGPRTSLLQHCYTEHAGILTNDEIVVDFMDFKENHLLLIHNKLPLIFKRRYDHVQKVIFFELYTHEFELNVKKYSCQLTVNNDNKSLLMTFKSTSFEEIMSNKLNVESLMGATNVVLKLTVGEAIEDPKNTINLDMLSLLKCFICSDYAVPPIHHCVGNTNTLCSDCKLTHDTSCVSCIQNKDSTRNINLDKMANLLNYPCKYRQNGCTFVSKPDQVKKHQSSCELGDFDCPVSEFETCVWKGPWKELEKHIQNNHQELVTNSSQISKSLQPGKMKCDIIKFLNQLFRLVTLKTENSKYLWTVQTIGASTDDFKYEIEIVDPLNKGRRLLVRQQCGALINKDQLFKVDKYCYFMNDQIRDFVVDQIVTFKVHIFV